MRAVVVPGTPALLAAYAGRIDPLPEVRSAALEAVGWLVDGAEVVRIWCDPLDPLDHARGVTSAQGERIARELLTAAGFTGSVLAEAPGAAGEGAVLVVANGSARRTEKAPGHLDERSHGFDAAIEKALASGDGEGLAGIELGLGAELLAAGLPGLKALGGVSGAAVTATLDLADDPFGVRYWVARWS